MSVGWQNWGGFQKDRESTQLVKYRPWVDPANHNFHLLDLIRLTWTFRASLEQTTKPEYHSTFVLLNYLISAALAVIFQ